MFKYDTERIHYQGRNDRVVKDASAVISDIMKFVKNGNYSDMVVGGSSYKRVLKLLKISKGKNTGKFTGGLEVHFNKLEDIFYKRFGVRFKLYDLYGPSIPAAVYPYVTTGKSVMVQSSLGDNLDSENSREVKSLVKNMEALKKTVNGGNLVVNLKEARVEGLPDNFGIMLTFSPIFFTKLGSLQILAIMLHEIGHFFGTLSYQNRVVLNTLALNQQGVLGRPSPDKLRIYNSERGIGKPDDSDLAVTINFLNATLIKPTDEEYASLASNEIMADNFAVQFGLGKELFEGLDDMNIRGLSLMVGLTMVVVLNIGSLILDTIINYVTDRENNRDFGDTMASSLRGMMVAFGIYYTIGVLSMNEREPATDTYGTERDRFKRIKYAMISNLGMLEDSEKKKMIEQLEYMEKRINTSVPDRKVVTAVITLVSKDHQNEQAHNEAIRNIEAVVNNDAKVASARLQYYL